MLTSNRIVHAYHTYFFIVETVANNGTQRGCSVISLFHIGVSAHFQIAPATHQSVQTGAILLKCRSNTRRIDYVRYKKTVSVVMPAEVRKAGGLY